MNATSRAEAAHNIQLFAHQHPPTLLDLARHAALPVALDPGLVHLLRTNFFLDRPDGAHLPATAEADLLLSNLCHEVGDGLYEMDPAVRDVLLEGLGEDRLREVATLLWQYTTRRAPWIDHPMLERAQQLTALSVLDVERSQRWLDEAEGSPGTMGTEEKEWFVAMRQEVTLWKKAGSRLDLWSLPSETDLFLSYNTRDYQAVERVARWLMNRGLTCFMDRWYLVPGMSWPVALEQALDRSKAVAVFLGPGEMGRWQQRELQLALDRQVSTRMPVVPVLLPGADPPLEFLSLNTWVDLRARYDEERQLEMLVAAVRGLAPAKLDPENSATLQTICPFRGLLPYREEDAPFFFGRQDDTNHLVEAVKRHSFVAVLGASGSGKSSVIQAGLVPRLRSDPATAWDVVTMVPTARPLHSLLNALSPLLWPDLEDEVDRWEKVNEKTSSLERGTLSLRDLTEIVLAKQPGTQRLLLVVDQWEELYTLCCDDKVIRSFTDQLLDASRTAPVTVVFACRADFYGHVLDYRPLVDRFREDAQVSLGPMDERELRVVVEAPAAKVRLEFEPGLPSRILRDMGREPGQLPLLSFLLEQLWKQRRGAILTHEAYDAMGGVEGAIATEAEAIFARLPERDQELLPRLFIQLVSVGEESEDTRRRAALTTLGEEARPLIELLATARLLVTSSEQGIETVELAHEALIRHWKRSQGWVNNARGFLTWRRRLQPFVEEWWNRDRTALLRGLLLTESRRWRAERPQDLYPSEHEFIEASIRQQEKEERWRFWRKWRIKK